ncbi:hypothetical protein AAMO2058_000515000 [Amorphochlora amoebiformis]
MTQQRSDTKFREWLKKQYTIGARIGKGAFSRVYRIKSNSDGKTWALKVIKKSRLSKKSAAYLETEIEILRSLDHKHICRLKDVYYTDYAVYLFLEYMSGGDLLQHIVKQKTFTEEDARHIIQQIAMTLEYIHGKGVIHRDLKPDNIIYRSEKPHSDVVLADFGLAKQTDASRYAQSLCGTPLYLSPEMIRGPTYDSQCDMWSLGVILFVVLSGRPPFYAPNQKDLFKCIVRAEFRFPERDWKHISPAAKDAIRKLLVKDPAKRLTAQQLLQHPWLQEVVCARNRGFSALSNPEYKKRVKILLGTEKMRKGIRFLIRLNRFFRIIEMETMRQLKADDLKDIGKRRNSGVHVVQFLPSEAEWREVKRGSKRMSVLQMTAKVESGLHVVLPESEKPKKEYVLKRPCSVLRNKGYWWIVPSEEKDHMDESKWIVAYAGDMVATETPNSDAVEVLSRKSVFQQFSQDFRITQHGGGKASINGAGMLYELINGCVRMRKTRFLLMEIVSARERQSISFWNHVTWFKSQHNNVRIESKADDDEKYHQEDILEHAKDIWRAYLRPGAPLFLSHIPQVNIQAIEKRIEKKNISANMFESLSTVNMKFILEHTLQRMEEVLKVLNQFWANCGWSKGTKVSNLRKNIPDKLWHVLGTEACLPSTEPREKSFKEDVLHKKSKSWFRRGYSKRLFRIHVRDSKMPLPEAYLTYYASEDDEDASPSEQSERMSILLTNADIEMTGERNITITDGKDKTKKIVIKTREKDDTISWYKAMLRFKRTKEAEVEFSSRLLQIVEEFLKASNLASLFVNPNYDPLRPAYVLYGKWLYQKKVELKKVRDMLNEAILHTFQEALGRKWDSAFQLTFSQILKLWVSFLEETIPFHASSRKSSKALGLALRRTLTTLAEQSMSDSSTPFLNRIKSRETRHASVGSDRRSPRGEESKE